MADEIIFNENDKLMVCITERLGERQYKMTRITEMEKSARRSLTLTYGGISTMLVAACIACLFVFNPFNSSSVLDDCNISQPSLSEYRGGAHEGEIEELMKLHDYFNAMEIAHKQLVESDKEIASMNKNMLAEDEELQYEMEQIRVANVEIRWMYIYLLVKNGKYEDAITELEIYLRDKAYVNNSDEAERLLNELKK